MSEELEYNRSKSKKIELIIQQLNGLPTLPAVAARLLHITVREDTQADEVVRLIESDPALASRIIMLATRAHTGMKRQTASLSKAVVLLGFDTIRNAVLSIKVFEALGGPTPESQTGFDRVAFWKHSLAVACGAKMLIPHLDRKADPEEAFLCGLLHDMGKVALDACLPKSFARVVQLTDSARTNIAEMEQKILGIDHTVVGKRLAEKWGLPESIKETVWLHHHYTQALPEAIKHRSIVQAVHLADVLAREQRIGYSGNHNLNNSATAIAAELGCPDEHLDRIARTLRDQISDRGTLLGLDEMNPDELYHEALGEANRELGDLNLRLQYQNRILRQRGLFFEMLSELGGNLTPTQTVVDVCRLIADLWQQKMDTGHCAVYAREDDECIIEGAVKLSGNADATIFLVDQTDDPDTTVNDGLEQEFSHGFKVLAAGEQQSWFFEQVAPMFDIGQTLMMPLRRGKEMVGSILWEKQKGVDQYQDQLPPMEAFAAAAALALRQAQRYQTQQRLSEQLVQANQLLHEAQKELVRKRSLAVVGEMACGAAHEVNNPLAVVVGRSQLLASSEEDKERKEILKTIADCGQEVAQIVSELLEFAQPSMPQPLMLPIADLIDKTVKSLTERAAQENVQFEIDLAEFIPDVFIDEEQILSALRELLTNAMDSYQGQGGTVQITGNFEEFAQNVIVEIIDRGCGMTDTTVQKAIDPFFSQRHAGRGRGLGLSRSNRYIEANGGTLQLASEPGQGSIVRLRLPVTEKSTHRPERSGTGA